MNYLRNSGYREFCVHLSQYFFSFQLHGIFQRPLAVGDMHFDEVVQAVNPFGPYQKRVYFLLCLFAVPDILPTLGTVFLFATPEHR